MAVENPVNLQDFRIDIYPLREINLDNYAFGYPVSYKAVHEDRHPRDYNDEHHIPMDGEAIANALSRGYRPYRPINIIRQIGITESLQAAIEKSGRRFEFVEPITVRDDAINLIKQELVIQETMFDIDNPVLTNREAYDVSVRVKPDPDAFDVKFIKYWSNLASTEGDICQITLNDGSETVTVSFHTVVDIPVGNGVNINLWNLGDGFDAIRDYFINLRVWFTADFGSNSTYTSLSTDDYGVISAIRQNILAVLDYRGAGGNFFGSKDRGDKLEIGRETINASFVIENIAELDDLRSRITNKKYGILIYRNGIQPWQEPISGTKIANFDNCFAFGIINDRDFDIDNNAAQISGYRGILPAPVNFMDGLKTSTDHVTDGTFDTGVTQWSQNGSATRTYDATDDNMDVAGLAATSDYLEHTLSAITNTNQDARYLFAFSIADLNNGTAKVEIQLEAEVLTFWQEILYSEVEKEGVYHFVIDAGERIAISTNMRIRIKCETAGTAKTFTIDNIHFIDLIYEG